MYLSPFRIATAAAVLSVALVGAAFVGRMTVTPGVGGFPTTAPSVTPDPNGAFIAYRDARDEICERYVATTDPLRAQYQDPYAEGDTPEDRAPKVAALTTFAFQYDRMLRELAELDAPEAIAPEQAADLARLEAVAGLLHGVIDRLNAGDLAGARSLDEATDPINREIARFETRNVLSHCP